MNRDRTLKEIGAGKPWDVLVIGGGATGLGAAVEAAARGYRTLLVEQEDFAKGTSSRSTKLAHGGVRYLQQGNLSLVIEALGERGRMLRNAPHLIHRQSFLIPAQFRWELPFYGLGLKFYDALAVRASFGASRILSAGQAAAPLRGLSIPSLRGAIQYFDGQFDDARLAITLALTLEDQGGAALNHAQVCNLLHRNGRPAGVQVDDLESGERMEIEARVVVNATGVFSGAIRALDEPEAPSVLAVSQGTHFVLPAEFLPGTDALMIPRTADGRVLFAIPWYGRLVVGTTDEAVPTASIEPRALDRERHFLKQEMRRYLRRTPERSEILSMWSGLRPLVRREGARSTAALSREHSVLVSRTGLVTVIGGKWTTYRRMGEDAITAAARASGLPQRASRTANLHLHGWMEPSGADAARDVFTAYGTDLPDIEALIRNRPELGLRLDERLPYRASEVIWAVRNEMARTLEDVLSRRTRALFLDARAAMAAAPGVARLMAAELGRDQRWIDEQVAQFSELALGYLPPEE